MPHNAVGTWAEHDRERERFPLREQSIRSLAEIYIASSTFPPSADNILFISQIFIFIKLKCSKVYRIKILFTVRTPDIFIYRMNSAACYSLRARELVDRQRYFIGRVRACALAGVVRRARKACIRLISRLLCQVKIQIPREDARKVVARVRRTLTYSPGSGIPRPPARACSLLAWNTNNAARPRVSGPRLSIYADRFNISATVAQRAPPCIHPERRALALSSAARSKVSVVSDTRAGIFAAPIPDARYRAAQLFTQGPSPRNLSYYC